MVFVVWSPKGGSGVSVVSAATALASAKRAATTRLVDLTGDQPALLAMREEPRSGLAAWLAAGDDAPDDALDALALEVLRGLTLLPLGSTVPGESRPVDPASGQRLAAALRARAAGVTVVDAGVPASPVIRELVQAADASAVVLRGCYLALRRAAREPLVEHASGVVLIEEPGRALGPSDVTDVLGRPVLARVPWRSSIARVVDAGLLAHRMPEALARTGEALLGGLGFAGSLRGRVA